MFSTGRKVSSSISNTNPESNLEEKFDYTDSEFELTFEKQTSDFPLKFHDFMATLVGKRKLLAEAEVFDKSRGVVLPKREDVKPNKEARSPVLKEQNQNTKPETGKTDRRISSVEFPKSNNDIQFDDARQVNATPYISNPTGTSIEDHLLVQSTPLSKSKMSSDTQPRDLLKEKLLDNHRRSVSESSSMSRKPTELREELSKFKDGLSNIDKIRVEHEKQIKMLMETLENKDTELKETKKALSSKSDAEAEMEDKFNSFEKRYENLGDRLKVSEENELILKQRLSALEKGIASNSSEAKDKIDSLTEKLATEQDACTKLLTEVSTFKLKNKEQAITIDQKSNQISILESSLERSQKSLQDLAEEKEILSSESLQYKCEAENLQENLEAQKGKYEDELKAHNNLKNKFTELESIYEKSEERLIKVNTKNKFYENFIQHMKIFNIEIGEMILPWLKNEDNTLNINQLLSELNIIGFKTKEDDESMRKAQNEIEKEWKPKLMQNLEDNSLLKAEIDSKNEKMTALLDRIDLLEESKEGLLVKNEKLLVEIAKSQEKIKSCELSHLSEKENTFMELTSQNLKLIERINSAKEEIAAKSNKLNSTADILKKEKEQNVNLKTNLDQTENSLTNLKKSFEKIRGNPAERITSDSLFKIHRHINKTSYQLLELESIENLSLVECQNALKNIIAILDIPYSKFSTKLPLVNIMLRYEKTICFHFANRVHYLLFHGEIDSKTYTKKALENYWSHRDAKSIEHPLEQCLNDLYKTVRERLLV